MKNSLAMLVIIPLYCSLLNASAQTGTMEESWKDGNPRFLQASANPSSGVQISETISLVPQKESHSDDTLNMSIDGIDWRWPQQKIPVSMASDIDYRTVGDQQLYLVCDPKDKKVFEINANLEQIVWSYSGEVSLSWPTNAQWFYENNDDKFLITDMIANKILIYNKDNLKVEWEFGDATILKNPVSASKITGREEFIIADRDNNRILIVNKDKQIIWVMTGLNSPVNVDYNLETDEFLVTEKNNHRIFKVKRGTNDIVWQFGITGKADSLESGLNSPSDADFLPNGNLLITDEGNRRLIEITPEKKIVWSFRQNLDGLKAVRRLPDNRHLAVYYDKTINTYVPVRLGFKNTSRVSRIYDLAREVNYDRIFWQAEIQNNTQVKLQIRTANSLSALEVANWFGPEGSSSYYTVPNQEIGPIHDGDRFYQFRVFLETSSPLYTPLLNSTRVDYYYFRTEIPANFWSYPKTEKTGFFIAKWKQLKFTTIIPENPNLRDKIQLEIRVNEAVAPFRTLATFIASKTNPENAFNLEAISGLVGLQKIHLLAFPSTTNSSVSPILDEWELIYDVVPYDTSKLKFVDKNGIETKYFRATTVLPSQELKVDSLDILLTDLDQVPFQNTIHLTVHTIKSGDSERVALKSLGNGQYRLTNRMPILISDKFIPNNQIIEVPDRDTLTVLYRDPKQPEDISSAKALVVKNSGGELTIENPGGKTLTSANFNDVLYVRVQNEIDRNLDPTKQETILVRMFDNVTIDEERITLFELPDKDGKWNSNNFLSLSGIVVQRNNNGQKNNGILETLPGHRITVEYIDNVTLTASVLVPSGSDTTIFIYLGGEPYVLEVAPNPYYEDLATPFRLRVASATGNLIISSLEIFNLAGEKVREIAAGEIIFDTGTIIPKERFGVATNWWNLRNESGHLVSSGTYWVKLNAKLVHEDTGDVENVNYLRKFVLIR